MWGSYMQILIPFYVYGTWTAKDSGYGGQPISYGPSSQTPRNDYTDINTTRFLPLLGSQMLTAKHIYKHKHKHTHVHTHTHTQRIQDPLCISD